MVLLFVNGNPDYTHISLTYSGAEQKIWFGVGADAVLEGWEPEAATARRFDETGATKYTLVSHDPIVSQ